jgi:hypothetical protein
MPDSTRITRGSGSGSSSASSTSSSSGYSSSSSSAEVPWYEYHEFRELSSRTFRSLEEQLYIKKAQLKRQRQQHAAILIPGVPVQLMKALTLKDFPVKDRDREEFKQACFEHSQYFKSLPEATLEVDMLEQKLLGEPSSMIHVEAREVSEITTTETPKPKKKRAMGRKKAPVNLFDTIKTKDE